jgi:hypothetical protein
MAKKTIAGENLRFGNQFYSFFIGFPALIFSWPDFAFRIWMVQLKTQMIHNFLLNAGHGGCSER